MQYDESMIRALETAGLVAAIIIFIGLWMLAWIYVTTTWRSRREEEEG
jgi:cbb3-type cytochrome oxidase subunit 3